jgi:hypothetical protein
MENEEDIYGAINEGAVALEQPLYEEPENQEDIEFENEYNVYERVENRYLQPNIAELGTDVEADLRDPIQRFTSFTRTVAQDMVAQGFITLRRADIYYIIEQIQYVPYVKYKNPTAFVLGFWVVKRDGTIDKSKVNKLIEINPNTEQNILARLNYPVRPADVIRYANFWILSDLYAT